MQEAPQFGETNVPSFKREDYRGYRIEAVRPDAAGWRVNVYRRSPDLPAPGRPDDARYPSAETALDGGRTEVDWLLSGRRLAAANE